MNLLLKIMAFAVLLFTSCTLTPNSGGKSSPGSGSSGNTPGITQIAQIGGNYDFINPEQTNEVETPVISVDEARNIATQFILDMGLASMNGPIKQFPQFIYMTNARWGPVVFVENTGEDDQLQHRYYYVFFGKMPDGALCATMGVEAQVGKKNKVFTANMINYQPGNLSNNLYLFGRHDSLNYVISNYNIPTNATVKIVFCPGSNGKAFHKLFHWKYEISKTDGSDFYLKNGKRVDRLYCDPFIYDKKPIPNKTNGFKGRSISRINTLEDDSPSRKGKWRVFHKRAHYEEVD